MDHEQAQTLLSDFCDESLSPGQKAAFEAHVEGCPTCQGDLELLNRTLSLVRRLPPVSAPAHFASQVRRRIKKAGLAATSRQRRWMQTMIRYEATLVVLLATVGALIVLELLPKLVEPVSIENPPVVLALNNPTEVNGVASAAWRVGADVRILGRLVPPGSPLGAPAEMEVVLSPETWAALISALGEAGLAQQLPKEPPKAIDGRVSFLVQLRPLRPASHL